MLKVDNVTVRYDKHLAVDNVSFFVSKGETVVILGANGAGKSSLLKALAGIAAVSSETKISLDGQTLIGQKAHEITNTGIALVPEGRGVIGLMTVEENLRLGANPIRARAGEVDRMTHVYDIFPRLKERRNQLVRTMSGGEQQMVAVGRAMMSNPEYLLLDEPSLGLAPIVVTDLFKALNRIKEMGVGMLIVEQNVRISLRYADRGYLLEAGRIIDEGSAEELMNDKAIRKAFLGGDA